MTGKRKLNWLFGYQAVVYAAGLLLATGLVPDWGAWYSSSTAYRDQTESLLDGNLAVSGDVRDLKFDHTWSEEGVHQVWGLGVPLWRLPFEAVARLFGAEGFPDRIAFGLFALLVCFVTLKVWVGDGDEKSEEGEGDGSGWRLITGFGAGFIILLLFPPFLTLLQTRGAVWEEAVSYEYLFAVLQLAVLVWFVRRPDASRLLIVCGVAGLGGLVRPTLVFYGFAAMVIAIAVWIVKSTQLRWLSPTARSSRGDEAQTSSVDLESVDRGEDRLQTCPTLRRILSPVLLGVFLFCLGGGVLWLTNLKRFGNGFEFGHKLNVQYLYGSMYATRFDDPFKNEPITSAAKEVFGAAFLAQRFNGADWYQENIFPGQSPTVRWREFYFRTFDWTYLPFMLFGWGAAVAAAFAVWRGVFTAETRRRGAARSWKLGDGEEGVMSADSLTMMAAGLWSLMAAVPLLGFYLYAPVISSRYMMDLAPAFAAAIAAAWMFLAPRCRRHWSRTLMCVLLCGWVGVELYLSRSVYGGPSSITWEELKVVSESRKPKNGKPPTVTDHDEPGDGGSGIPFDRVGWDQESGALMPLVILFVQDAQFLELELETREHPGITPNPEDIRAKIGLEYLEREQITKTVNGWKVRFRGPQQSKWNTGVQSAFVATVPNKFLAERTTPWVLKSVRWR